jgi:DNA polymerase elongation subunit (family B)
MTSFHILDSFAQDIRVEAETDTTREVTFVADGGDSGDDEIVTRKRGGRAAGSAPLTRQEMVIHLFGTTASGQTVRIQVTGFHPFFFVRLPDTKRTTRLAFEKQFAERAGALASKVKLEYQLAGELIRFTNKGKFPFVKLSISSIRGFYELAKLFLNGDKEPIFRLTAGDAPLDVYEANLDPMLRFFHLRNIQPCGWVTIPEAIDEDGILTAEVSWDEIVPTTAATSAPFLCAFWDIECYSETGAFPMPSRDYFDTAKAIWKLGLNADEIPEALGTALSEGQSKPFYLRLRPGRTADGAAMASALRTDKVKTDLQMALSDKENDSDKVIKDLTRILNKALMTKFPLAGDPMIQIGVALSRNNQLTERHIFVSGSCDSLDEEGVVVHSYKDEKAMTIGWAAAMAAWNVDMLIGYNTFGFDEKYLWIRAQELGVTTALQPLSRLADVGMGVELVEKFLSSSALGDNNMFIWSTYGRLQIDMLHYIKRNNQLPEYKLDYVCQHFMSGKIAGLDTTTRPGRLLVQTKNTTDVIAGRSIVLLDETGDTIGDKYVVEEVITGKAIVITGPDDDSYKDAVKWAVVKDDVSPREIFLLHCGSAADRARIARYCVQDCVLVFDLYKKLEVFNNIMAMANACSVPVSYIVTRGQGIKIESLIFKECYELGQRVRVLPRPAFRGAAQEDESYEGAIVLPPKPDYYFESPVGVADFASLYPSTIVSENISYDTLVWAKDYDLAGRFVKLAHGSVEDEAHADPSVSWTDIEYDILIPDPADKRKNPVKIRAGTRVCRYAQFAGNEKGALPKIINKLLAARKAKRKEAEKEPDPFRKALLDAEQLAYKLTANSLYGQLGSPTFKIRLQPLAASVTAYGRKQIMFAKSVIEEFYGSTAADPRCAAEVVYGDTDSLFVNFNVRDPVTRVRLEGRPAIEATMALTEEAGKFVSRCLAPPHDFEYDKVFYPFIIFSKKRYVGNMYEESADSYYQKSMGIALKRRDYAPIVKVIYGGAIRILLTEKSLVKAVTYVRERLRDLVGGAYRMYHLTITKSLRSEYNKIMPPHKMLAERMAKRDPGNAPAGGDRMGYVFVCPPVGQAASKLQGERIESPAYIKEHGLLPDYRYYIEHQLMNPIVQLFALRVEEIPGYRPGIAKGGPEDIAQELIFSEALGLCDQRSRIKFASEKFGCIATPLMKTIRSTGEKQAPLPAKKQASINSFFLDTIMVKRRDKESKNGNTVIVEA